MILIPTILCGGVGSRLWPVSRSQHPKPFIKLSDGSSLLQHAFLRGALLPNVTDVLTVTSRDLLFKIEDEYRAVEHDLSAKIKNSFILEPFGRNTAPAIAAAALQIAETHGEDAILLVLAADHLISKDDSFTAAVSEACKLAALGKLVTFGIKPTGPETGYGYIEAEGSNVVRFVEKPTLEKAQEYMASGNFVWNSGMFCFTAGGMIKEMQQHCPDILASTQACLAQSQKLDGKYVRQIEIDPDSFKKVKDDSIDYAIMEKTKNAAIVTCDIGWSDIGCWNALGNLIAADTSSNRIEGDVFVKDTHNCTITSEGRAVGAVGVSDLIIIDTADALLVANKSHAQDVKHIYAQLKAIGHDAHQHHRTTLRPWGSYTILEESVGFKIKRIEVDVGASLSLQMHHHRSEHWVVVSGEAKVTNGDKELIVKKNESTYIPAEHKHRLENIGSDTLVMIEVQTGSYLGEDDIVRFSDIYGRV
jgi:mannose-1-phosphate guanylyltransferase/mannose-6-phosphate isomerase